MFERHLDGYMGTEMGARRPWELPAHTKKWGGDIFFFFFLGFIGLYEQIWWPADNHHQTLLTFNFIRLGEHGGGGPLQEVAQLVIIIYPFHLDLRKSAHLFLNLMHMKERRQHQVLADIKVEKKCWAGSVFASSAHWKSNEMTNMDIYHFCRGFFLSKGKFICKLQRAQ